MSSLSLDAESALALCKKMLASLAIGGDEGRRQFESCIHPDGGMFHARYSRGAGTFYTDFRSQLSEYCHHAWDGSHVMEEGIDSEPTVLIDHDLATVWTPYWVRMDGVLSHVGTNSFGLLKMYKDTEAGKTYEERGEWEWKIVVAHDTARKATDEERQRLDESYSKRTPSS